MPLLPDKRARLDELVTAVCEERLDTTGLAALEQLLRGDAAAQRHYLRAVQLHHALRWQVAGDLTVRALQARKAAGLPPPPAARAATTRPTAAPRVRLAHAAAAAVLLAAGGIGAELAVRERASATPLAHVQESHGARGGGLGRLDVGDPLGAARVGLGAGLVRLELAGGSTLSVQGPADVELVGATRVRVHGGVVVASSPEAAPALTLEVPGARVEERGAELGVAIDGRGVKVAVLEGEAEAVIERASPAGPSSSDGDALRQRLASNDGLTLLPGGAITTAVVGDTAPFEAVRPALGRERPLLANASFEIPSTNGAPFLAAAGWTLEAHPLGNANAMEVVGGAGVREGRAAAPDGRQWGYLAARTFPDGRKYHTSMHQLVGPLVQGRRYRLSLKLASEADRAEGAAGDDGTGYVVGLYAGSALEGPTVPLAVAHGTARPPSPRPAVETVRATVPRSPLLNEQSLFVRIESVPCARPGACRLLVDDVRLEEERP